MPEFDLGGCWPLWEQFAPDERRFQCSRTWTTDPAYRDPAVRPGYREKPSVLHTPMVCGRTRGRRDGVGRVSSRPPNVHRLAGAPAGRPRGSWQRTRCDTGHTSLAPFPREALVTRRPPLPSRAASQAGDTAHCTAPCPTAAPLPLEWRAEWDRELAASAARPGASQVLPPPLPRRVHSGHVRHQCPPALTGPRRPCRAVPSARTWWVALELPDEADLPRVLRRHVGRRGPAAQVAWRPARGARVWWRSHKDHIKD